MTASFHPKADNHGKPVVIMVPTQPTSAAMWHDATDSAVFVPAGSVPAQLSGVPISQWTPPTSRAGWEALAATTRLGTIITVTSHTCFNDKYIKIME